MPFVQLTYSGNTWPMWAVTLSRIGSPLISDSPDG